jgi:succinate dehydrogenase / fumarate reductase, iron-sulfur subunit
MNFTLDVWRQPNRNAPGKMVRYEVRDIAADMSFFEMLDLLNAELVSRGEEPVAFDQDCREGICGTCGMVINGIAHGPQRGTAACQLHMRSFRDGEQISVEPWRARPFGVIKDLVVDRSALDRIVQAGGYISVSTGSAPEANAVSVPKQAADRALDAAACIACGACVAACPNSAAHLFTGAKVAHLNRLPQGQPERRRRVRRMVDRMESEGFGSCSNYTECEAVCPVNIQIDVIAQMNREYLASKFSAD